MSENLDLVRSIYADWERGDFSRADWADPEIEFALGDGIDQARWRGLAEVAAGFGAFLRQYDGYRSAIEECRDCGDDRVLAFVTTGGRGKRSGIELTGDSAKGASTFHLRAGKVVRIAIYRDRANALADLGLKE